MTHRDSPISLLAECAALPELWSPRVLAQVNDQFLKVARVCGEFPWHSHEAEDELFLVLKGVLTIGRAAEDGGPLTLQAGEVFVVPRGLRHNTSAEEETSIVEETWIRDGNHPAHGGRADPDDADNYRATGTRLIAS